MLPARLRQNSAVRALIRENRLNINDVIMPLFVVEGENRKEEIPSMKGQYHLSSDRLIHEITDLISKGVRAVLLFGVPDKKDSQASCAYDPDGVIQKAIRTVKENFPDLTVIADVCLCEYKSDGHCCFFTADGSVDRKRTLEALAKTALSYAEAGADMVAPSDMTDGNVRAIRESLDENGFERVPIMGYSAKYASDFYGPFREAAHSAPAFGNRRAYQMDPANSKEALKEIEMDLKDGADILMVKPAMPYLDIIAKAKSLSHLPLAAYQVSGEYAMLKNAVDQGLLSERAIYESLLSIKRAGADLIITYFASDLPDLIEKYQDNE